MPSLKDLCIGFLLFWEDAMESLTESVLANLHFWKEVNIKSNESILSECSSEANDISHVAQQGEN